MNELPAISVEGLRVRYGSRDILKNICLEIRRGEILVIMGGSGSGKSTFLRHLLGLEQPLTGNIHLLGQDITKLDGRQMHS
ncbi:MAG: ATP-binding cassette domain-containing protein, partial [Pseudomonadota bacterium]